jgi:hypothetical protein
VLFSLRSPGNQLARVVGGACLYLQRATDRPSRAKVKGTRVGQCKATATENREFQTDCVFQN